MPPKYKLHITEGTLADYEVARAWWEVNRPKAPLALQDDLRRRDGAARTIG